VLCAREAVYMPAALIPGVKDAYLEPSSRVTDETHERRHVNTLGQLI
jgi:hypothetical protein